MGWRCLIQHYPEADAKASPLGPVCASSSLAWVSFIVTQVELR